ncbi:hypothetical protein OG792_10315 [Micromonospora sp. NBC_01699]|nr:hypothetical protein [Micromonospora sp. NBC_01699]
MSSLVRRVRAFLQSPRGRQLVDRGRRELAKPSNQQRLRQLMARFNGRRR